ncbi:hypothetical protein ERO13_D06G123800v2 [Gossypium hirsutum]|nr:hypothetical protein ERO13_D06G123800v2 [Gossypium hirsutum]
MALQSGEKLPMFIGHIWSKQKSRWTLLGLRLLAFLAAAAATLVMFHHTPAFVFFAIANGLVSIHNLVMIMMDLLGSKFDYKGFQFPMIASLDMLNLALVSGGANAAAFMAELGKNGNSHARWDKICDKFGAYCDRGAGALIASFLALALMLLISFLSILNHKLVNSSSHNSHNNIIALPN